MWFPGSWFLLCAHHRRVWRGDQTEQNLHSKANTDRFLGYQQIFLSLPSIIITIPAKPVTQTFNHNCFLSGHQKSTSSTTDLIWSDDHNQKCNPTHRSNLIWWSQPARTSLQPRPPTPGVLVVGRSTSANLIFARCQQRQNNNINKIRLDINHQSIG